MRGVSSEGGQNEVDEGAAPKSGVGGVARTFGRIPPHGARVESVQPALLDVAEPEFAVASGSGPPAGPAGSADGADGRGVTPSAPARGPQPRAMWLLLHPARPCVALRRERRRLCGRALRKGRDRAAGAARRQEERGMEKMMALMKKK